MTDVTISLRIDKRVHEAMKLHDEVNWSATLRKAVKKKLAELQHIDTKKSQAALRKIKEIRKSKAFDKGKTSTEIIREWRDKRR